MNDERLCPVDAELAQTGACWYCHTWFEHEDFYYRLGAGTLSNPARVTCLGCSALLLFDPR